MRLVDDPAAAKAGLDDLIGKIEHGDLEDVLAKEAGGALAALKTAEERAAAVKDTLTHLAESMRLLRARLDFGLKVAALGKLKLANTHGGPGRVDDFGAARDLLFDVKFARPMGAPCSIPQLWGTAAMRWTNYDNTTQSTLERSVATALAGGAVFDPATYQSTVIVRNVGQLELLSAKITAPDWPEAVFGKIDRARAERGAVLFKKHCAECHVAAKRPATLAGDKDWPPDMLFDLDKIGTDPSRARNFAEKLGDRPYAEAVQETIGKYLEQAAKDEKVSTAELDKYRAGHKNVWRTTLKYAARPLSAVWATPPYLHNGSVPTIYDLLRPAKDRPRTFALGQRDYDPAKLGYATPKGTPIFTFDTTLKGNSNAGHEYGTDLADEQRYELIEYLKAN
jgi:mono/diheme cytochrome c family protein